MSNYARFRADDLGKSKILAQNLQFSSEESQKIENWFAEMLEYHEKFNNHRVNFDKEETEKTKDLTQKFQNLKENLSANALKYATSKAICYRNIFDSTALKSVSNGGIFGAMLPNIISECIENHKITLKDLVFISDYLRENWVVSPNGDLLENILKIDQKNKISKKWQTAERQAIVKNLLRIIQQKNYHHSIVFFKKVLSFIQKEDIEIQELVKNFEVENKQGCYQIIHKIFQFPLNADAWQDFSLKMELLQLLDTANGALPKEAWLKKYALLSEKIGKNALNEVALEVSSMENCLYAPTIGWKDEVVRRFLKASAWIKEK